MDRHELNLNDIKLNKLLLDYSKGIFVDNLLPNPNIEQLYAGNTILYMLASGYAPSTQLLETIKTDDKTSSAILELLENVQDESSKPSIDAAYETMLIIEENGKLGLVNEKFLDTVVSEMETYMQEGYWPLVRNSSNSLAIATNLNFAFMRLAEQSKRANNIIQQLTAEDLKAIAKELLQEDGLTFSETSLLVLICDALESELQLSEEELQKLSEANEEYSKIEIMAIKDKYSNNIANKNAVFQNYFEICDNIEATLQTEGAKEALCYFADFQKLRSKIQAISETHFDEVDNFNELSSMYIEMFPDLAEYLTVQETFETEKYLLEYINKRQNAFRFLETVKEELNKEVKKTEKEHLEFNPENVSDSSKIETEQQLLEIKAKKTQEVYDNFIKKAYVPLTTSFRDEEYNIEKILNSIKEKISKLTDIIDEETVKTLLSVIRLMNDAYQKGISGDYVSQKEYDDFKLNIEKTVLSRIDSFYENQKPKEETPEQKIEKIRNISDLEEKKQALISIQKEYDDKLSKMNAELKELLKQGLIKPTKENLDKVKLLKDDIQKLTADKVIFEEFKQREMSALERKLANVSTSQETPESSSIAKEVIEGSDITVPATEFDNKELDEK